MHHQASVESTYLNVEVRCAEMSLDFSLISIQWIDFKFGNTAIYIHVVSNFGYWILEVLDPAIGHHSKEVIACDIKADRY